MCAFVETKKQANKLRQNKKEMGRCSCYTKTREGKYYVSDCPLSLRHSCLGEKR